MISLDRDDVWAGDEKWVEIGSVGSVMNRHRSSSVHTHCGYLNEEWY